MQFFYEAVSQSSPADMSDVYPSVRLDLGAVLVPGSSDVLVRHFAFKECLILRFHGEVGDALVDFQLFFYPVRKTEDQRKQKLSRSSARMPERTE